MFSTRGEIRRLTLRPTMFSYPGPDFVQDKPIMYRVEGLPAGWDIRIGTMKQRWLVLRSHRGTACGWEGDFSSPEEALEAVWRELLLRSTRLWNHGMQLRAPAWRGQDPQRAAEGCEAILDDRQTNAAGHRLRDFNGPFESVAVVFD